MQKKDSIKIKGMAILLLLFHHLFYNAARVEKSGMQFLFLTQDKIEPIAVSARICVQIFIFLSAYGLAYQYGNKKETIDQWLLRRWITLMKSFWIIYIVVFFLFAVIVGNPFEFYENNILKMVFDIIGWSDFFGTPMLMAPWWYMCFAQIILLCIPIMYYFCGKFGWGSYIIAFLCLQYLPEGIVSPYGGKYSNYFLVIVLAVLCVRKQMFEKVLNHPKGVVKKLIEVFGGVGIVVALLYLKYKFTNIDQWQINSIISSFAVLLICVVFSKYFKGKIIEKNLQFLGKHSGNIFMVHAFFYTFTPKLVYWSENAIISFLSLLFISLVFSIVVEKVKKIIHYNECFSWLIQKGEGFLN